VSRDARIEEKATLPLYHPFEIHLATERERERETKTNQIYRTAIQEGIPF
jgi:hypothetical protein